MCLFSVFSHSNGLGFGDKLSINIQREWQQLYSADTEQHWIHQDGQVRNERVVYSIFCDVSAKQLTLLNCILLLCFVIWWGLITHIVITWWNFVQPLCRHHHHSHHCHTSTIIIIITTTIDWFVIHHYNDHFNASVCWLWFSLPLFSFWFAPNLWPVTVKQAAVRIKEVLTCSWTVY